MQCYGCPFIHERPPKEFWCKNEQFCTGIGSWCLYYHDCDIITQPVYDCHSDEDYDENMESSMETLARIILDACANNNELTHDDETISTDKNDIDVYNDNDIDEIFKNMHITIQTELEIC